MPHGTNLEAVADYYGAAFPFEQEKPESLAKVISEIVVNKPVVNFNNLQELDIETFINKHSIVYNKVAEGSYEQIFQ